MTGKPHVRGLVLFALLGQLLAPAVGAQSTPLRVVQGSDGALYLAQGGNAWTLVPTQMSDEDLAGLSMNGEVVGAIVGPSSPLQVVQGSDGALYLAQSGNAWALVPDQIGDDDLAVLSLGPEVDGSVPPALLSPAATPDLPTPTPGHAIDTPTPVPPTATPDTSASTAASLTATPVPPTATPVPASTSTPMPTAVPTMTLYGSVTHAGQPVANATVRVLELSPLSASSRSDGSFRLEGLQQSSYTLLADDGDLISSPLSVPQSSATLPPVTIELVAQPGGQPSLFVGQVGGGKAAADAMVWRLGGAGQTKADRDGKFWLVDAHVGADGTFKASPTDAVIVAAKGNRWGFAVGPFKNDELTITLTRTGSPPQQPKGPLMNLKDKGDGTTIPQQGVDAVFTARWSGSPTEQASFTPAGTSGLTTCQGACKGVTAQGWAAFLPKGSTYTLGLATPDFANTVTTPRWVEAQVVAYPAP